MNPPLRSLPGRWVPCWIAAAAFLLLLNVAGAQEPAPPDQDLTEARSLRDAGHLQEAAAAYERLIAADPGAWEPRYDVAQIYVALKQYDLAEQHLQAALLSSPRQAAAWARLGQVYLLKSDSEKAERALRRARDLNPADAGVRYNLGKLYEKQSRDAEALAEYLAFLENAGSDPRTISVRRRLAMFYENTNRLDKALEQHRKLSELEPNNVQIRQGLADALYMQSSYDEAFAEYKKVLALDPNNAAAYFNVGFILKTKGNLEEAEGALNQADSLAPGAAKTLYQIGAVQFERGNYAAAAASFEKAIAVEPDHPQAHYHYSRALVKLGRMDEARRELQTHQEILRKVEEKRTSTSMERP